MKKLKWFWSRDMIFVFERSFDLFYKLASFTNFIFLKTDFWKTFNQTFFEIFEIKSILAWPNLLCYNQLSSCNAEKHLSFIDAQSILMVHTLTHIFLTNKTLSSHAFSITHFDSSKITLYPLSHNWLMLRQVVF